MWLKKRDRLEENQTVLYVRFNSYYQKLTITLFLVSILLIAAVVAWHAWKYPEDSIISYAINKAIWLFNPPVFALIGRKTVRRGYFTKQLKQYLKEKQLTMTEFSEITYIYPYDYEVDKDGDILLNDYAMRKFSQYLEGEQERIV